MSLEDFLGAGDEGLKKYFISDEPDLEEVARLINKYKHSHLVTIFARCSIDYEGRARSKLGLGERVIITKPDGTLLVHEDVKREPINWQPPGSKIKAFVEDEDLLILSVRERPREILKIKADTVYFLAAAKITRGQFELFGSEKSLVDAVVRNPELIEDGLRIVRREANTPYGFIDLVGVDKNGKTVVMEFKRSTATISAVLQLIRYIDYYEKVSGGRPRGLLVAPDITDYALFILKSNGLEFKKIGPKDVLD